MNDILKQRLVGALILIALGVVFWPIIFVQPGDQPLAEQAQIPPAPAVDTTPIEPPDTAGLRPTAKAQAQLEPEPAELPWPVPIPGVDDEAPEPSAGNQEKAAPDTQASAPVVVAQPERKTRSEAPEKLAIDSDGLPIAWILQVASVSSADKAEQLRKRLLAVDHKAYVKRVKSGNRDLYRVYIGPRFERAALQAIQPTVDTDFGVKSMIARYVP